MFYYQRRAYTVPYLPYYGHLRSITCIWLTKRVTKATISPLPLVYSTRESPTKRPLFQTRANEDGKLQTYSEVTSCVLVFLRSGRGLRRRGLVLHCGGEFHRPACMGLGADLLRCYFAEVTCSNVDPRQNTAITIILLKVQTCFH